MSIKIIGGLAKSRSLFVPKGEQTRPTSVLLKRRVFDSHQDLSGFSFFDLCAGSGSVGFEAWSRGADSVMMIENHRLALTALQKNLKDFQKHFPMEIKSRPIQVINSSIVSWIKKAKWDRDTILFLDPPYEDHQLVESVTKEIFSRGGFGMFWLESDRTKGLPAEYWEGLGLKPKKIYHQGTSYIAAFEPLS